MYRIKGVFVPIFICVYMFPGWEEAAGSKLAEVKKVLQSSQSYLN